MNNKFLAQSGESLSFIRSRIPSKPDIALILGSGLGPLADRLENPVVIPYEDIPHFAKSTVEGHEGTLVYGKISNKDIICMKGRFHYYEGHALSRIIYPLQIFKALGIKTLVITNAAGGINKSFSPGDLMIIKDHINMMGNNPLIGPNSKTTGPRFPDMSEAYSKKLIEKAKKTGKELKLKIKEGVYVATTGPSYETPAEVKMFRIVGADAVGMSTVPEVLAANHMSLEVFAISCITNMAAGVLDKKLSHDEVTETANRVRETFIKFISSFIKNI